MKISRYILVDGVPVPEPDLFKWAAWMEGAKGSSDWILARTTISKEVKVSTVFLGLDHNFDLEGPPEVFETMIFGGPKDQHCWRYSTKADALLGHENAIAQARDEEYGPREWSPRKGTCFCKRPHDDCN